MSHEGLKLSKNCFSKSGHSMMQITFLHVVMGEVLRTTSFF